MDILAPSAIYIKLDDIGLFKTIRNSREKISQRDRAIAIRDQFAECMNNAIDGNGCIMPELCANGAGVLKCAHLCVDYSNFTGGGMPLTGAAKTRIDQRLRAIGTMVRRVQMLGSRYLEEMGRYPGDVHIQALNKISSFEEQRGGATRSRVAKPSPKKKSGGFFARVLGW